jgi:hypothetical protein
MTARNIISEIFLLPGTKHPTDCLTLSPYLDTAYPCRERFEVGLSWGSRRLDGKNKILESSFITDLSGKATVYLDRA